MNSSEQPGSSTQDNMSLQKKSTENDIALQKQESEAIHLKKCREYFRDMDVNGDGKISTNEFAQMIQNIGITLDIKELKQAYAKADKDGDGAITFKEFLDSYMNEMAITEANGTSFGTECTQNILSAKEKSLATGKAITFSTKNTENVLSEEDIKNGCKYFWISDKDCDGKLNITEFSNMLVTLEMKLTQRDINKAFRKADLDENGYIGFWEFVTAYLNEIQPNALTNDKIKGIYYKSNEKHKGFLTREEFREAMEMLGNELHERDLKKMMTIASNGTGTITLSDFCSFLGLESERLGTKMGKRARRRGSMPLGVDA